MRILETKHATMRFGGVTAVAVNSPAKVQSAYDAGYMGILEAYIPARSVKIYINKRK